MRPGLYENNQTWSTSNGDAPTKLRPNCSCSTRADAIGHSARRMLFTGTRRAFVQGALVSLLAAPASSPLPAHAATIATTLQQLDQTEAHNTANGKHSLSVEIGAPNSDAWCSVDVAVPSDCDCDVEYIWIKDASTPLTRRVYSSRFLKSGETPVLRSQLKVGYRAKPLMYSKRDGLFEGEVFEVTR